MTCLEKLMEEYPERLVYNGLPSEDGRGLAINTIGCPHTFGYLDRPENCIGDMTCIECWKREIPDYNEDKALIRRYLEKRFARLTENPKIANLVANEIRRGWDDLDD